MEYLLVYTTFPTEEDAVIVAKRAVEKRLASCVNIFPKARSFYEWKGSVQDVPETIMILKTRKDLWDELRRVISSDHPYEVPAIISISMADANPEFLRWVDEQTQALVN